MTLSGFAREVLTQAHSCGLIARLPRIEAVSTAEFPIEARRPANWRLESSRAARDLGLLPSDWRVGLAATLDEISRKT